MKRFFVLGLAVVLPLFFGGCSPEVAAFGKSTFFNLAFIVPLLTAAILIIFALNKLLVDKNGQTKNGFCSLVGAPILAVIFAAAVGLKFGFALPAVIVGAALGAVIGFFSYTLDELMTNFWEERRVTVPGVLGLIIGGWFTISIFTHVWLEGDMFVTHQACDNRVIVERYTKHTDSDGDVSYTWDYEKHYDKFAPGWTLPQMVEGIDYQLGTGAKGKKDRVKKTEGYYFIGGHFYSEKRGDWDAFQWLLLANQNLQFKLNQVQRIQSNFYGQPMKNAGVVSDIKNPPAPKEFVSLPPASMLPAGEIIGKTFTMAFGAIGMMFTEDEYRPILYIFLSSILILVLLAIFVPPLRMSIGIFVVCASIVLLLLMLVAAAKSGGLRSSRRRSGGGGRFSGGGTSW